MNVQTGSQSIYAFRILSFQARSGSKDADTHKDPHPVPDASARQSLGDIRSKPCAKAPMTLVHLILALSRVPLFFQRLTAGVTEIWVREAYDSFS